MIIIMSAKVPSFIEQLTTFMIIKRKGQISNPDTITLSKKAIICAQY